MQSILRVVSIWVLLGLFQGLPSAAAFDEDVTLEGGDTSVSDSSSKAFDQVAPNLRDESAVTLHEVGQTGFLRDFGKVKIRGALRLGPTYNSPSCVSCHSGNGRGELRITRRSAGSDAVLKVSLGQGRAVLPGGPAIVPRFGLQIRDHAVARHRPDALIKLIWRTEAGAFGDGGAYSLRSPIVQISKSRHPLPRGILTSLRRAPPVFGAGLLDAVSDLEITRRADPTDADGDGISGRANVVWNAQSGANAIGRFGFKAATPTLRQQVAAAYATDMGVTNSLFKGGRKAAEISDEILGATTFYSATLGVPMARNQSDPTVLQGRQLFAQLGCASCHSPTLTTGSVENAALSGQTIHPFSDLLLHDMGDGLADNRPEFLANGSEWRTTPLWGIGLTEQVLNGKPATYLHDGRARSLEEAILWHAGEASGSREGFKQKNSSERAALIQFLRSL